MIKPKQKPCKGRAAAKGYGCGKVTFLNGMYKGLCDDCYPQWYRSQEKPKKATKVYSTKSSNITKQTGRGKIYEKLQIAINKLQKAIDYGQPCICNSDDNNLESGHYYSRGAYPTLAFNLDNIHPQSNLSNQGKGGEERKFIKGITNTYYNSYALYILGLPLKYKNLSFTLDELEVAYHKVTLILKRDFKILVMLDADERMLLRNRYNLEIGLYKDSNNL